MHDKLRLLRVTTASISLKLLLKGQFNFFKQQGFDVLTVSADGPEVKDILALGVAHQIVPMTRAITPILDLICLYKLVRLIRDFQPDIVHSHTPKAGLLGMMAARICNVPMRLHTVAGLPLMEASGLKRWILKLTERITYSCSTNVYPNSKGLYEFIQREFNIQSFPSDNAKSKFKIIGRGSSNGIDSIHYSRTPELIEAAHEIRSRFFIPDDIIVFCFVGRVVKDKGIVELVHAFKKLSSSVDARLLLVGPFEQELDPLPEDVMHCIQHDTRVVVAGFQQDVRPWILASEVFVFPSYREGFPNVVMQAACLEVPCIVSDINGCNEIIEDQVSGLIVPPKDESALYEAMALMTRDQEKRISFVASARKFVAANFDQQFVWNELLKEYQRLIHLSK